jgi:aldose 1-epimerase
MTHNQEISQYDLRNSGGMTMKVLNYGATITEIFVPDRYGNFANVVLGFDSLDHYLSESNPYFGSVIGRYSNRIKNGRFKIHNGEYFTTVNNNGNTLHGGHEGFNRKIWKAKQLSANTLHLEYHSPDGEEGFPGNLKSEITLTLDPDNAVKIEYYATTDKPSPVSFTNHSYFNLSSGSSSSILDHELMIAADYMTPIDSMLIPTGELAAVINTPFDFNTSKRIGKDIERIQGGYDHNFALKKGLNLHSPAAVLYDPSSGRTLELFTTAPGLQFYTGNFLDGTLLGKGGINYQKHAGLCLEPQHFPDSPNQPSFPTSILNPGQVYHQMSIYRFSIQ